MILDSFENIARYAALHPRLERAFAVLNGLDLLKMEPGRYEFEGSDLFLNLTVADLKDASDAYLEVHNDYLDVQLLLEGEEGFGWSPRSTLSAPQADFDQERDIQFFNDRPQLFYALRPGWFTIFFPEDAHAPLLGEGKVRKAILKVKL